MTTEARTQPVDTAHVDAVTAIRDRIGRIGVWTMALGSRPAAIEREAVAAIENLGFGALWFGEAQNKEAFAHAAILLAASRRIVVASGIANIWARDAVTMALGADTLAEAYPGRFLLGIGVSHGPLVGARGHTYERPLATMQGYLDAMDATVGQAPAPVEPVQRVLAALRPKMLGLARDRAAGAHPYFVPPAHTAKARALLGNAPLLAPEQAVVLETDPARARAVARRFVVPYLTLPNYVNNLRDFGFGDDDFAGGGSDRLADAIVAWGDVDAIQARVREHLDAGADHVCIQPLPTAGGDRLGLDQLAELAPALVRDLADPHTVSRP